MRAHPAEVRARVLRLLRAGKRTMAAIARRTGVPRRTVQSWARRDGQEPRPPTPPPCTLPPAKQRKAVELYLENVTLRQITIRTGASPAQVRRLVRDAGHPLRSTHTKGRFDTQEVAALAAEVGVREACRRLDCTRSTVVHHVEKARRLRIREELLAEEARKGRRRAA
ncbi:MAG: helix-turn-helix domain-containing protein [Phycicoccus sp.]